MNRDRAAGPGSLIGGGGLLPPPCTSKRVALGSDHKEYIHETIIPGLLKKGQRFLVHPFSVQAIPSQKVHKG